MTTSRRDFLVQSAGALTAMALVPELHAAPRIIGRADPLTVGLVGCGRQGRAILTELAKFPVVKVTAVCDVEPARREGASKRVEGATPYATHADMLDKDKGLKAVIIATPTHKHREVALDALAAGKHVYCEAPLAHTVDDCKAIAAAAAGKTGPGKQVFQVGLEGRSNPVYKLARTFFRSDAVRDFVDADAAQFQKTTWRFPVPEGGNEKAANWRLDPEVSLGLVGEWGVQQIDVVNWYIDQYPTNVLGAGSIRLHNDGRAVHDTVRALFTYGSGANLTYAASLANSYAGRWELMRGTNAAVKLAWTHGWMFKEADAPTQGWEVYANRQQFFNDEGITLIADATKLASQGKLKEGVGLPNTSLYYALEQFLISATEGKPCVCDAATGARSSIVAILAAQAAAKGTALKIDPAQLNVGA
jgi:predicted dehydrogenase